MTGLTGVEDEAGTFVTGPLELGTSGIGTLEDGTAGTGTVEDGTDGADDEGKAGAEQEGPDPPFEQDGISGIGMLEMLEVGMLGTGMLDVGTFGTGIVGTGIEQSGPIEVPLLYAQNGALEVPGTETEQSDPEPPLAHGTGMLLLVTGLTGVEDTEQSGPEPPLVQTTGVVEGEETGAEQSEPEAPYVHEDGILGTGLLVVGRVGDEDGTAGEEVGTAGDEVGAAGDEQSVPAAPYEQDAGTLGTVGTAGDEVGTAGEELGLDGGVELELAFGGKELEGGLQSKPILWIPISHPPFEP